MSLSSKRINYLLEVYTSKRASVAEEAELMQWIRQTDQDSELKDFMLNVWENYQPLEDRPNVDWKAMYTEVIQSPVIPMERLKRPGIWRMVAAAAVILFVVSGVSYFYFSTGVKQPLAFVSHKENDIAPPTKSKALLTLSNGMKIELDSSGKGVLAMQGNVRIVKRSDGEISYSGTTTGEVNYNTLSVPKGSRPLSLTLSDGSRVWLNLGSSITYPTAFTGDERKIKMSGEAYFEIAHNEKMPFIVQYQDVMVRVLGTHFNVNAYEDEKPARVTLLQGSVRINKGSLFNLLKPGQQAQVSSDIQVQNDVDIDEVMAWKNEKFRFGEKTDIGAIMRQIARWYNVDVEYKGTFNQHFWGSISRDVNLSEVLKVLEATGGVKFKVEGTRITVMPASH